MPRPTDDLVREFHEQTGQEAEGFPTVPDKALVRHRMRLIHEEYVETMAELQTLLNGRLTYDEALEIMGRLLKEMADLRYVLDGTAVSMGLPYEDAYRAVHASNMSKRWPDGRFRTDQRGKVLKGPNYRPPDMFRFVPRIINVESEEIV